MKHLCTFVFVLTATFSLAQEASLPAEVVKTIEQRIAYEIYPGIAVGIIDSTGNHYFNFGKRNKGGKAIDEHTIFEIGSITKTFTGILLADQILKGKLSIDDSASKYLPGNVTVPSRDGKHITLGHLSDHTSAIPRMPDNFSPEDPLNPYADYTVEAMYEFISSLTLTRDIGGQYEYSNLAQGLLGHILALQAETTYEELMIEVIANPLNMDDTRITFRPDMKKRLAVPHSRGLEVKNWDIPSLAGAGAIRSSTADMLKYLSANMGLAANPLEDAMKLSHQVRYNGKDFRVGLGWHISDGGQGDIIWHNGGTGGYRAFAGFVKETQRGVVVLANSDVSVDDIGFHLLDATSPLQEVKPHVARELRKHIDAYGPAEAEKEFAELKKEHSREYDFGEMEINALGYYYLGQENVGAALAMFKINTVEYPGSSNVWDSYGEALMIHGDTSAAIENYQRSLALNPGNTNAVEMLAKMGVTTAAGEVEVGPQILQSYVGTYELMSGFSIKIFLQNGQLHGQATGQPAFEMFAKSETEFFLKIVDAQIKFNKDDEREVESLTLYQGGQVLSGKKID